MTNDSSTWQATCKVSSQGQLTWSSLVMLGQVSLRQLECNEFF